ncbi:MAG: hypothetical protein PVF77_06805 [Anaerolineae bacterium]
MYYAMESRITALTTIRRERLLPAPGQVLVSVGETVGPDDVVARCQMPGEVRVIDVSRVLGVHRERAAKYLRKEVGDTVQANDVLAAPGGLFGQLRKSCRSPMDGQVAEIRGSLILIESPATTFELRAHIMGRVTNVMPNRGVVISAAGTLIQGMWGSGGEAGGVLKVLVDSPQKPLRPRAIDVSCHGTVIVGGWILDEKVLEQAVEANVRGIIAGGGGSDLCPVLKSLPCPVLLTEGFGPLPMSTQAYSLLTANAGREAVLSAETQTRLGARRPEVLIPLRADEEMPREETALSPLKVGDQVRALRAPHLGVVGTVADLPALPHSVESGARLPVAMVDVQDEGQLTIPLANLEMIH